MPSRTSSSAIAAAARFWSSYMIPTTASESPALVPPAAASYRRDYTGNHVLVNGKCRMTATQWPLAVHGVAESWRWLFPGYFKPAKDQVIRHRGGSKGQY